MIRLEKALSATALSSRVRAKSAWVNARADDQPIKLERVWLALAMGRHKRLGERSQIGNINSDVLMSIVS